MYQTVITLKDNIPDHILSSVRSVILKAFDNRAGKLPDVSTDPFTLIFEGTEPMYGCLDLGMLALRENAVLSKIKSMQWIDEEPEESCDMLEIFAKHSG